MKAGTATKLVLNMITTGAMIRLGKTFGNLMVDLRATNAKLRDRSERILMEVCEVDARSRAGAARRQRRDGQDGDRRCTSSARRATRPSARSTQAAASIRRVVEASAAAGAPA